ncbi:MAG: carboxylesterase family protein, partial [Lachnospiraceae bacterium]
MRLLIQTKKGMVEGVQGEGFAVFRGIPFAKPPVGELRWRAPQEVEPWEGVYKADHFAKICPQAVAADPNPYYREFYADPAYDREQSEDCLYLNVWVPDQAEGKKCPVAMFIHGGAFNGGYSSEIEFDGAGLARRGVILVTIAYRLGVFGFLAHPWLSAESARHVSGNYGILDQIAALNWVYDNIGAFGGDP